MKINQEDSFKNPFFGRECKNCNFETNCSGQFVIELVEQDIIVSKTERFHQYPKSLQRSRLNWNEKARSELWTNKNRQKTMQI